MTSHITSAVQAAASRIASDHGLIAMGQLEGVARIILEHVEPIVRAVEGELARLGSPAAGRNDHRVGEPSPEDPKLDACPRCNGRGGYSTRIYRDGETKRLNGTDTFYRTNCMDCGFTDNGAGWLTRQAAADSWNKQPARASALARAEQSEALLREALPAIDDRFCPRDLKRRIDNHLTPKANP